MKSHVLLIYAWLVRTLLFFLPDIPLVMRFRGWLYGFAMKSCGKDFQVTHDAIIRDLQLIVVGNNCFVGNGTIIMGGGEIILEDQVMLAPRVIIISGNHTSKNGSYRYGKSDVGQIVIGRGSWVAGNAIIQKDSQLPVNSVLSANSFLNRKFDISNAIYGGVPAKLLKVK